MLGYTKGPERQGSLPFAIGNVLTGNSDLPIHLDCPFFGGDREEKQLDNFFNNLFSLITKGTHVMFLLDNVENLDKHKEEIKTHP